MADRFFFGYGSLVNCETHDFKKTAPARIKGWRRVWVQTAMASHPFLSAYPVQNGLLLGAITEVPAEGWAGLDKREAGYVRLAALGVEHPFGEGADVQIYSVPAAARISKITEGILLSYLDVVVQGFLREFGPDGVAHFFATTDGWDVPIINDRRAPRYPRYQNLTIEETELVDEHLKRRSVVIS